MESFVREELTKSFFLLLCNELLVVWVINECQPQGVLRWVLFADMIQGIYQFIMEVIYAKQLMKNVPKKGQ